MIYQIYHNEKGLIGSHSIGTPVEAHEELWGVDGHISDLPVNAVIAFRSFLDNQSAFVMYAFKTYTGAIMFTSVNKDNGAVNVDRVRPLISGEWVCERKARIENRPDGGGA